MIKLLDKIHYSLRMFQIEFQKYDNLDHKSCTELQDFDWKQWLDIYSLPIHRYHNLWQQLKIGKVLVFNPIPLG